MKATGSSALQEIALQLANERKLGISSKFKQFLDVLPDDITYMPTMWSDEKLVSIYGTTIFDDVVTMRKQWLEDMKVSGVSSDDMMDVFWARATLQGRGKRSLTYLLACFYSHLISSHLNCFHLLSYLY